MCVSTYDADICSGHYSRVCMCVCELDECIRAHTHTHGYSKIPIQSINTLLRPPMRMNSLGCQVCAAIFLTLGAVYARIYPLRLKCLFACERVQGCAVSETVAFRICSHFCPRKAQISRIFALFNRRVRKKMAVFMENPEPALMLRRTFEFNRKSCTWNARKYHFPPIEGAHHTKLPSETQRLSLFRLPSLLQCIRDSSKYTNKPHTHRASKRQRANGRERERENERTKESQREWHRARCVWVLFDFIFSL